MGNWLKLIRWQNLLIVFLTQLLVWYCVILPAAGQQQLPLLLHPENFLWVSLSTILVAAAGYIINDYFDIKIDLINRPDKVILENRIPRRMAIIAHSALNIAALLLAWRVARQAHHPEWLLVQLICTILLWFYSTHFKRQFMIGNIIVALLTAFTIIVLLIYEPVMHYYLSRPVFEGRGQQLLLNPAWLLCVYAYFAFVLTWMREIVKDMEDFKGDAEEGCITMPIRWGLLRSVRFTQTLGIFAILPLLVSAGKLFFTGNILFGCYVTAALTAPISAWIFYLPRHATAAHYHNASRWLKIIMVLGIGSLIIHYLLVWLASY